MGELGLNKIFGAILAAALGIMGLQTISSMAFSDGGHHGHHGEKKPFCESVKDDNAYWVDVPCAGAATSGPAEKVIDLGTLLAAADASKGERTFKSVCSSCHTIDQGGSHGTGPNLYGIVNRDIASISAFDSKYSSVLKEVDGGWTYDRLNEWTTDPQKFARGSGMVAKVTRNTDRANLIAYLASSTPGAPEFPAPIAEEAESPAEGDAEPVTVEGTTEDGTAITDEEAEAVLDEMEEIVDRMEDGVERLDAIIEDDGTAGGIEEIDAPLEEIADPVVSIEEVVGDSREALPSEIIETVEGEGADLLEQVEEAVEGVEMPEAPIEPELEPAEEVIPPR